MLRRLGEMGTPVDRGPVAQQLGVGEQEAVLPCDVAAQVQTLQRCEVLHVQGYTLHIMF